MVDINTDKALSVAIIGSGAMAKRMITALVKLNRPITGIYSRNVDSAFAIVNEFGLVGKTSVYDSLPNLWEHDVADYVYVATPTNTHLKICLDAIYHRKHVFVEKPMVMTVRELADLQMAMLSEKIVLMEQNTILFSPLLRTIGQKVKNGKPITDNIGKATNISVNLGCSMPRNELKYFDKKYGGGVLWHIGGNAISAALVLIGHEMDLMTSYIESLSSDIEEPADARGVFTFKNKENVLCTVSTTFLEEMPNQIILCCERGYAVIDNFPQAVSFRTVDEKGREEFIDLKSEILKVYNLQEEQFSNNLEISTVLEVLKFENAVNLGFKEFSSNDTTHFKESFATMRLVSEILARAAK